MPAAAAAFADSLRRRPEVVAVLRLAKASLSEAASSSSSELPGVFKGLGVGRAL